MRGVGLSIPSVSQSKKARGSLESHYLIQKVGTSLKPAKNVFPLQIFTAEQQQIH